MLTTKVINNKNGSAPSFGALHICPGVQKKLCKLSGASSVTQKLVIGATALAIQPWLDLRNKSVDENTRKTSASRSIGRAIAGTATGLVIRQAFISIADKKLKDGRWFKNLVKNMSQEKILARAKVIGTFIALGVMMFTNFIIDAPLTNIITDFCKKHIFKDTKDKPKEAAL